ncbi:MAG: tRNA pseudouridine(55) synthase TruB, partial [Deltaproteobacteria bacterium]
MKPRLERDGVLVLDKPVGISSFDAIRFLRSHLRIGKIGHTGTLDPLASGVLPIVLNRATRLSPWLSEARKGYEATLVLGEARDTQDATGRVVERAPIPKLDVGEIERILDTFLGEQTQIPPMYSAVHHEGRRLYELAREGIEVARAPRRIEIDALTLLRCEGGEIVFRVFCSKGTYIRTLAADIAHRLGTVGHLGRLRRIRSGPFGIEEAHPLEEIAE